MPLRRWSRTRQEGKEVLRLPVGQAHVSDVQGQVLNLTSAWWMQQTQHLAANALLDVPDPNVSIMQRCTVFPVEFVVRGFLTGDSTAPP